MNLGSLLFQFLPKSQQGAPGGVSTPETTTHPPLTVTADAGSKSPIDVATPEVSSQICFTSFLDLIYVG